MPGSMPAAIAKMPKPIQQMIKQQCGGDWARVTVTNGAVTVHNTPQRKTPAAKKATPARATPPVTAPVTTPVAPSVVEAPAPPPPAPPVVQAPPPPPAPPVLPAAAPRPAPTPPPQPVARVEEDDEDDYLDERAGTASGGIKPMHPAQRLRMKQRPAWDRSGFPRAAPVPRWKAQPEPKTASVDPETMHRVELPPVRPPARRVPVRPPAPRPIEDVPLPSVIEPRPAPPSRPSGGHPFSDTQPLPLVRSTPPPVVALEPVEENIRHDNQGRKWILLPGVEGAADWANNLETGTMAVWHATMKGVPPAAHLYFHDDVTALHGIDLDLVETACRAPHRVEVAPETATKKYPVIKYYRGDVLAVVGFRDLQMPKIIAAYTAGLNLADNRGGGARGGGGSRRSSGLPKTVSQLLTRLGGIGVELIDDADGKTHTVKYWGEDLGQIPTATHTDKATVESSYQRINRKVEAIKQRKLKQNA